MLPSVRVMLPPMENTCECSCSTYRMNASGNPPSTGITCPVVFALASPASQQMAFAQSRGRIGSPVIVRFA